MCKITGSRTIPEKWMVRTELASCQPQTRKILWRLLHLWETCGLLLRKFSTVEYYKVHSIFFSHLRWHEPRPEAYKTDVHPVPNAGAGEGIPLQPLPDQKAEDRDRPRSVPHWAADKDLVPEQTYEGKERNKIANDNRDFFRTLQSCGRQLQTTPRYTSSSCQKYNNHNNSPSD